MLKHCFTFGNTETFITAIQQEVPCVTRCTFDIAYLIPIKSRYINMLFQVACSQWLVKYCIFKRVSPYSESYMDSNKLKYATTYGNYFLV